MNLPEEVFPLVEYAVRLLSAREYAEKMMMEKMEKKFPSSSLSDRQKVIDFLTEKKYLDEQRTAENFLRYRREYSPRGKMLISRDMYLKKINPEISAQVLETFSEEEEKADCLVLAGRKWENLSRGLDYEDYEEIRAKKDKLFRFLAGKGFRYHMIQAAWEEISE